MYEREETLAVEAVRKAARLCQAVRADMVSEDTLTKKDRSPVTVADLGAQAVISLALRTAFPNDPLMGEEDTEQLRHPENRSLLEKVVAHVQSVEPDLRSHDVIAAIDRAGITPGAPAAGSGPWTRWTAPRASFAVINTP